LNGPLDDLDFSGDKHLSGEMKEQIDRLYEGQVVETILKHFSAKKEEAYRWHREKYGEPKLVCECLPQVVPELLQHFTCCKLKFNLKRVTSLNYKSLDESVIGEAVRMHGAEDEFAWIITDTPFMPGNIVIGKRSFPLAVPFTGYVVAGEDQGCYLLSNLRQFLQSPYCQPRQRTRYIPE
jgi:hypothetical protein